MPETRYAAVILAAGASRRLGHPKQLVPVAGETLLHRTARLALAAGCSPVHVVLGFEADSMRSALADLPASILVNHAWPEGMGSSLRSGIAALAGETVAGVLLLVCDQPRLTLDHLQRLLERHAAQAGIAASVYAGRPGVPAVFGPEFFPELLAVAADQGARDLLRRHAAVIQGIAWPQGELDLDLPKDLERLIEQ